MSREERFICGLVICAIGIWIVAGFGWMLVFVGGTVMMDAILASD